MEKLLEIKLRKVSDELVFMVLYQNHRFIPRDNFSVVFDGCSMVTSSHPALAMYHDYFTVYLRGSSEDKDNITHMSIIRQAWHDYPINPVYLRNAIMMTLKTKFPTVTMRESNKTITFYK